MTKTWLITGSAGGFGRDLTQAVLAHGDNVVATARKPEQLDDVVREYGERVRAVALDVTDAEAAKAAVRVAVDAFGSLDIVVNNAGYANIASIEEVTDEDFRAQIETNLFGVVNVTKAALPVLREQRSGHFIQFSSIGGRVGGTPGLSAYQTAKFAVAGFSEVLNNEVKPLGIKVTIVEPGGFRTNWSTVAKAGERHVAPDYDQSVGEILRFMEKFAGTEPGDPARAAQALIEIANTDEPPVRLLLGTAALRMADESSKAHAAEAERWAELSRATDFPE